MLRKGIDAAVFLAISTAAWGQCPAGESAVTVTTDTDAWGYEVYWEIVDAGDPCGSSTWAFGGNSEEVGCDGNGNGGGSETYASNAIITEGPYCLPSDSAFDFIHVDVYGDGGTNFEIAADGAPIAAYNGTGDGNVWTFTPSVSGFVDHDSPCSAAGIAIGGDTVLVSTEGATASIGEPSPGANPLGGCGSQGWWCGSDGNVARSVWLTFTATTSDPVVINTCIAGTTMDTQLALYKATSCGDWAGFELVGAADDIPGGCGPGNGYASRLYSDCLEAGATYFIQLDGWGGSSGEAQVAVAANPTPEAALVTLSSDIDCPLSEEVVADGQILATLSGSGSDFTCTIAGPSGTFEGAYASGLLPGTYTIDVETACGAQFSEEVTVAAPSPFQLEVVASDPTCDGAQDGAIDITLSGGSAPYEFAWSNAAGFDATSEDLEGLVAGWYDLQVTDDAGCAFAGGTELVVSNALQFSLGEDSLICLDQTLLLYGPPGLDYVWQDGSINQFLYIEAEEWGVGTYPLYLTVANDEGCEASDVFILTIGSCTTGVGAQEAGGFTLAPNPAYHTLRWQLPLGTNAAEILDAQGRLVHRIHDRVGTTSVADWPAGTYFVQYTSASGARAAHRLQIAH